ncbi:hypothetical protein AL036_21880 [Salipiger aestuarii]|nr:hypothetical protein AL036_21880 [Salipiger aestuarii]
MASCHSRPREPITGHETARRPKPAWHFTRACIWFRHPLFRPLRKRLLPLSIPPEGQDTLDSFDHATPQE